MTGCVLGTVQARGVAVAGPSGWVTTVVVLAAVAFWAWCLVDFTRTPERDVRTFPRPVWMVLLVLGSVVGAVLWAAVGRPQGRGRR